MVCIKCGAPTLRDDPPRYDVLKPGADLDHPETLGPYCVVCWPETTTAKQIVETLAEPPVEEP